jgi:tetratricopeptide (TPR) repeat protein
MGIVLKDKGDIDAAIDSYKQAIKIKHDYAEAYVNMGNALKGIKFTRPISELPEIIVNLLNKNTYVRPSDIAPAAISLIKLDKVFQSVLNRYFSGELEQTLEQSVSELSRIPLLLKMMEL